MQTQWKVHLALFSVSLIYAVVFSMAKVVMPAFVPAFAMIVIRVGVAALLFWGIHAIWIKERVTDRKDLYRMMLCSVFGVGANMLLFFKGLEDTLPINGAILMTNTPIFVVVIALLMGLERPGWYNVGGVLLASAGATLLLAGKGFRFDGNTLKGDIEITVNAIIYSFYLVYARPLMHKYHPLTVSKWTFIFGFLFVLPFGATSLPEVSWQTIPQNIWLCIVFIVLFASFLTYLLNAWALRKASSSLVGSYIYLQPLLATLIALLSGSDVLTVEKVIFMLLIMSGVYVVGIGRKKAQT